MLNRNAEALFWVGRYMERAENHARLIDVHYHLQQEEDGETDENDQSLESIGKWFRIVDALGNRADFEVRYGSYTEQSVLQYVTLDNEHSNSLVSCINHARSNLRTLREKVPTEMWDCVNAFYLWLREKRQDDLTMESPHRFYLRIKEWAALFQGISQSVMPRENEWHFIECGRYLERAENTLRIMQSVRNVLTYDATASGSSYPYLQAVLKSVSGYQVFRRYHADSMTVEAIIEFMVLHTGFPRSVHFALYELDAHLRGIQFQDAQLKLAHNKIIRQVGKVIADLSCMEREDLMLAHVGTVVHDLLTACEQLGKGFVNTFFRLGEASA